MCGSCSAPAQLLVLTALGILGGALAGWRGHLLTGSWTPLRRDAAALVLPGLLTGALDAGLSGPVAPLLLFLASFAPKARKSRPCRLLSILAFLLGIPSQHLKPVTCIATKQSSEAFVFVLRIHTSNRIFRAMLALSYRNPVRNAHFVFLPLTRRLTFVPPCSIFLGLRTYALVFR